MELYDLIKKNDRLAFVDARTGVTKPVGEMHRSLDIDDLRSLVFIYNDNQLPAVETLLNFYRGKHVVALLGAGLHPHFKQSLEEKYGPRYIYDPLRSHIEGYSTVNVSDTVVLFERRQRADYPIHPDIKLLMSTSGTTGSPKFVRLSDNNLVQNARAIMEYMPIQTNDVVPLNVPLNFVYGLSIFTTNCIKARTIVCTDKDAFQKEFWSDFKEYGYSTLGGVPYFYEMLHRIGFFKKDHPSLRYLTHTGGMLNHKLIEVIAEYTGKFGKQFIAQYGQTEAGGRMAFLPPEDLQRKGGSIGFPVKNGKFEIDEETSELIYYGSNVFGGYANSSADLQFFEQQNKLYTGDMARKDDDGYYYITGRIKRIVKLFGIRLNLDETELLLKDAMGGQTFICTGISDKYLAVVYTDKNIKREAVTEVLKEKLNLHASTLKVSYMEEVPLTPNGKVNYPVIKEWLESGSLVS
ncbi:long-chain fatty acid--CoA ligase [Sinomicrobium pectinilyticum]|uniref:Long-chain fatty acid--CoA ligase n=1 Tax=Sinomicrobium pectinilyticum TaxID=1084421 RepID=A0A3N0EYN9_SINP1|nr:AMP-binding protein [Sinomicrobium pectinilyticum]RNL93020.1 long-chain fatty acid--CoA ligase [Sinomicrobium pectinilyticum]